MGQPPQARVRVPGGVEAAEPPARRQPIAHAGRRAAIPWDDWTFRPTVVVRRGTSQGSGTIIASIDGETLVLTAAHVLAGNDGPVFVELHRYNLGLERATTALGTWPRVVSAFPAGSDPAADVAVVRIEKMRALPYVARLAASDCKIPANVVVGSIGIDLGKKLTSWNSRVVETASIELDDSGESRPFLITEKTPEHGRSGGGLFLPSGELIGVCVGHAALAKSRRRGVFSSLENVHHLLDEHRLSATFYRSNRRLANVNKPRIDGDRRPVSEAAAPVTTTSRQKGADSVLPSPPR
jgi:S1-C subfamily serine protease